MNYAKKYGVSRASRKYNKSRSYIYFWLKRWDGSVESLAVKSRRPHHHPNEHTKETYKFFSQKRTAAAHATVLSL
ncbi:MAG: helix-turn-helix domain-containing protein [Ruminococcus sp.]|nr:helix-turn-helix domain-containing protein [Ruminococcus sp.]